MMTPYELIALLLGGLSLLLHVRVFFFERRANKIEQRHKFFQQLIQGFSAPHNWKFLEFWANKGVRPKIKDIEGIEQNEERFGLRVVVFDHLFILWQVHIHREILEPEDITSFELWAKSWYEGSEEELNLIFREGDVFPLDFILWLADTVFKNQGFHKLLGSNLEQRVEDYRKKKR